MVGSFELCSGQENQPGGMCLETGTTHMIMWRTSKLCTEYTKYPTQGHFSSCNPLSHCYAQLFSELKVSISIPNLNRLSFVSFSYLQYCTLHNLLFPTSNYGFYCLCTWDHNQFGDESPSGILTQTSTMAYFIVLESDYAVFQDYLNDHNVKY